MQVEVPFRQPCKGAIRGLSVNGVWYDYSWTNYPNDVSVMKFLKLLE